jgi:hypothetical protein
MIIIITVSGMSIVNVSAITDKYPKEIRPSIFKKQNIVEYNNWISVMVIGIAIDNLKKTFSILVIKIP